MSSAAAPFTPEALKFLRGLKKNNTRDWFDPRKAIYERSLKAPLLALIDHVNHHLLDLAPAHVRPPQKTMLRIYRDIRFAADKRPYKTHISAWWAHAGMPKTSGAGFYFELNPTELILAAGVFMPDRDQLLALRRHLVAHHADLRRLLADKKLRALLPDLDARPLTRAPKGFSPDDPTVSPALDLLLHRQWGVSVTLPSDLALTPALLPRILDTFAHAAPFVALLNQPLVAALKPRQHLPFF
jgi:uncharacterized protein (TIGR02453 family)